MRRRSRGARSPLPALALREAQTSTTYGIAPFVRTRREAWVVVAHDTCRAVRAVKKDYRNVLCYHLRLCPCRVSLRLGRQWKRVGELGLQQFLDAGKRAADAAGSWSARGNAVCRGTETRTEAPERILRIQPGYA